MSKEVAIFAIITPAPGKVERFKEVTKEALDWIHKNEPETLQFEVYEQDGPEGVKFCMFERYASQAAKEHHESTDNYKAFFGKVMEEEMLAGSPQIMTGKYVSAFRR